MLLPLLLLRKDLEDISSSYSQFCHKFRSHGNMVQFDWPHPTAVPQSPELDAKIAKITFV